MEVTFSVVSFSLSPRSTRLPDRTNVWSLRGKGGGSLRQLRGTSTGRSLEVVATVACFFLGVKLISIPLVGSLFSSVAKKTVFPRLNA